MEKLASDTESRQQRWAAARRSGAIALAATTVLVAAGCAGGNIPVGCHGIDVQTTGTPLIGVSFDYQLLAGDGFQFAEVSFGDGLSQTAESDLLVVHTYPESSRQDYQLEAAIISSSGERYDCPGQPVNITTVT